MKLQRDTVSHAVKPFVHTLLWVFIKHRITVLVPGPWSLLCHRTLGPHWDFVLSCVIEIVQPRVHRTDTTIPRTVLQQITDRMGVGVEGV